MNVKRASFALAAGIAFLCTWCAPGPLSRESLAAPPPSAYGESPQALGDILKKTESTYQEIHAFTAYFRQWTTSAVANAMTTEASGKLYYQKPRQMRWEYEKPEAQVFVVNHQLAWLHVPSERQIALYDSKHFFSSPLAQTFFDGMVELKKNFEVNLDSRQTTKTAAVLKLIPRTEDPSIKTLYLWIELPSHRIATIESHDALGNINRIVLDSLQPATHLESKLFDLSIPPSTMVTDTEGRELAAPEIESLKQKLLAR